MGVLCKWVNMSHWNVVNADFFMGTSYGSKVEREKKRNFLVCVNVGKGRHFRFDMVYSDGIEHVDGDC